MKYFSLKRIKKEILQSSSSPKITALSMGIGVALAFGPIPGLHLITFFIINKLFKLNPVVMLLGILCHNPWTMIPIHLLGLFLGDLVLYQGLVSTEQFKLFPWGELGFSTLFSGPFWNLNGPLLLTFLKPFLVGSTFSAIIFGFSSYYLTFKICSRSQIKEKF